MTCETLDVDAIDKIVSEPLRQGPDTYWYSNKLLRFFPPSSYITQATGYVTRKHRKKGVPFDLANT
jgi:hypothetical protein